MEEFRLIQVLLLLIVLPLAGWAWRRVQDYQATKDLSREEKRVVRSLRRMPRALNPSGGQVGEGVWSWARVRQILGHWRSAECELAQHDACPDNWNGRVCPCECHGKSPERLQEIIQAVEAPDRVIKSDEPEPQPGQLSAGGPGEPIVPCEGHRFPPPGAGNSHIWLAENTYVCEKCGHGFILKGT